MTAPFTGVTALGGGQDRPDERSGDPATEELSNLRFF